MSSDFRTISNYCLYSSFPAQPRAQGTQDDSNWSLAFSVQPRYATASAGIPALIASWIGGFDLLAHSQLQGWLRREASVRSACQAVQKWF